ncbi:unnamed protein product [Penicillium salamii]|uniref:Uncharacterized protein n=1 Tax=Penicillium salamii TaxID=1612424 RepID=A0A9W4NX08_9EURO|nr:unnamed protein product [Penicillium salamii]
MDLSLCTPYFVRALRSAGAFAVLPRSDIVCTPRVAFWCLDQMTAAASTQVRFEDKCKCK